MGIMPFLVLLFAWSAISNIMQFMTICRLDREVGEWMKEAGKWEREVYRIQKPILASQNRLTKFWN